MNGAGWCRGTGLTVKTILQEVPVHPSRTSRSNMRQDKKRASPKHEKTGGLLLGRRFVRIWKLDANL
jgi:hypothetical protein